MELVSIREVTPESFELTARFTSEELRKAWSNQTNPDKALFYDIFSSDWDSLSVSQQLKLAVRVAELVEAQQATALNVSAGNPELK